jgi:low affinity Fe/Cu permease
VERHNRRGISGLVHWIDAISSQAATAGLVAVVLVACALAAVVFGVPNSWLAKFSAGAAAITLVMVFVIQLKLDELIRALPRADDHLVHVEDGSDDELRELEQRQVDHRGAVLDGE